MLVEHYASLFQPQYVDGLLNPSHRKLSFTTVDPFESLDMCHILDDLLPSDEFFLESLIQSDLLLDVSSVVTKSNPDFPSQPDLSSYVGLVESFDSSFEQQVSDPDEFYFSYEFFNSYDTEFVPTDSISLVDMIFL